MAHAELVGAFTTTAVIMNGMYRPKEPVAPLMFMPNAQAVEEHEPTREKTEEELEAESDYNRRVLEEAARQRAAARKRAGYG